MGVLGGQRQRAEGRGQGAEGRGQREGHVGWYWEQAAEQTWECWGALGLGLGPAIRVGARVVSRAPVVHGGPSPGPPRLPGLHKCARVRQIPDTFSSSSQAPGSPPLQAFSSQQ